jgi:glycosyltransferase involved in cell wall biosynthesis
VNEYNHTGIGESFDMTGRKPRVLLDTAALERGQGVSVYQVCEELFERLAQSSRLTVEFVAQAERSPAADSCPDAAGLWGAIGPVHPKPSSGADIVLSPHRALPGAWRDDDSFIRAYIVYELVALDRPELFYLETVEEVRNLVRSLDQRSVIFAVSEQTKRDLLNRRPDLSPAQVTVIPPAAGRWFKPCQSSERRVEARTKYRIPADAPYVLGVSAAQPQQNVEQTVHAFLRVIRQNPSSKLSLVLRSMHDESQDKLDAVLASTGEFRNRIIVAGLVQDEDLSALYSDALCFVYLPYHDDGLGVPALEAIACGTPVICATSSELSAAVGEAAMWVDADDAEDIAQAIEQITALSEQRQLLAAAGLRRSRSSDWDRSASLVTDALLDAHRRYLASPSSLLWQHQGNSKVAYGSAWEGDDRIVPPASYLGYENGAQGPAFETAPRAVRTGWPIWEDALPPSSAYARPEGGLRARGILKSGTEIEPLVSYVTVVRNNVATLSRAIESVQRQTYRNVEHIVVDGASTDGTVDLLLRYADRLDYFVSEPDRGLYDAINKAVPLARGQLICILNSDDWLEPHAAEIVVRRMRHRLNKPTLLTTGAVIYAVDGKIEVEWPPAFVHPGSYFLCANVCHNGIYATPLAYDRSGSYDSSYRIAADFKWIMACLDAGVQFAYTREVTVNYSLGGASGDARGHSLESQRVVSERFPFLSKDEVRGLYDSYFVFTHQSGDEFTNRVDSLTYFLRQTFAVHQDQPEFQSALAWAAMTKLEHPRDAQLTQAAASPLVSPRIPAVPSVSRSAKDLVKGLLYRYPRLYDAAIRSYARMRR